MGVFLATKGFAVKQIVKVFKYRLYPTKQQEQRLQKTFGCTRFVYNRLLYLAQKWQSTISLLKSTLYTVLHF